jgi:hypothetical protein
VRKRLPRFFRSEPELGHSCHHAILLHPQVLMYALAPRPSRCFKLEHRCQSAIEERAPGAIPYGPQCTTMVSPESTSASRRGESNTLRRFCICTDSVAKKCHRLHCFHPAGKGCSNCPKSSASKLPSKYHYYCYYYHNRTSSATGSYWYTTYATRTTSSTRIINITSILVLPANPNTTAKYERCCYC